jgi:hypothetical protein
MAYDSADPRIHEARRLGQTTIAGGSRAVRGGGAGMKAARRHQTGTRNTEGGIRFGMPFSTTSHTGDPMGGHEYAQGPHGMGVPGRGSPYDPEIQRTRDVLQAQSLHGQHQAGQYYTDILEGRGPSVAEQQMRAGMDRNIQAQMGLAAQARGGNLAAMQAGAAQAGAGMMMGVNQQAASLRAQEQAAALQGFTGLQNTMAQQALAQRMGLEQLAQQRYGTDVGAALSREQAMLDYQNARRQQDLAEQAYRTQRNLGWARFGTDNFWKGMDTAMDIGGGSGMASGMMG